jgi:hypothetical protein
VTLPTTHYKNVYDMIDVMKSRKKLVTTSNFKLEIRRAESFLYLQWCKSATIVWLNSWFYPTYIERLLKSSSAIFGCFKFGCHCPPDWIWAWDFQLWQQLAMVSASTGSTGILDSKSTLCIQGRFVKSETIRARQGNQTENGGSGNEREYIRWPIDMKYSATTWWQIRILVHDKMIALSN